MQLSQFLSHEFQIRDTEQTLIYNIVESYERARLKILNSAAQGKKDNFNTNQICHEKRLPAFCKGIDVKISRMQSRQAYFKISQ